MKNVLFATTALVAMGGAAYADGHESPISFSASAELGFTYTDATGAANDGWDFVGDYGIDITASGSSDSGISFGANLEVEHNDSSAGAGEDIDDFNVFVSGAFGTLTLGDIDSAYDKVSVGIAGGGLDDEASYEDDDGLDGSGGGMILRYDYSVSGFTLSGSIERDDAGASEHVLSAGVGYKGDLGGTSISFGAAYSAIDNATDDSAIVVSGGAGISGFDIKAIYQILEDGGVDTDEYGVSVEYGFDAISLGAQFYAVTGDAENESYGVWAEYDLGGGLALVGAVGSTNESGDDVLNAGLGFSMSF